MNKKLNIYLPLLIALCIVIGILLGNSFSKIQGSGFTGFSASKSNKLSAIVDLISNSYVDSVSTSELVENVIPEVLKNLDPHSTYIPVSDMQEVVEEMQGNFGGIGVHFSVYNDTVQVIDVVSGGPSNQLGILPGDRIVTVNDSLIAGVKVENQTVLNLLRGEKGTKVNVGVKRKGIPDLIDYEITRGDIPIYSVDVSYMINATTGYVKVSRFAEQTYNEFMDAKNEFNDAGVEKVIVDLRSNPGGYLMAVIRMVNEFLHEGELIVYTEGNSQARKTYTASNRGTCQDKTVIVLIDEYSASASEIFAGAIQDNDRGIVVGRRSFGKGLVQEQIPFNDGSALRLTVARYYTPSGRSIQKPYNNGNDQYFRDIMTRINRGEFQVADSIEFADSLKYKTKAGRTVYGGGGIMPDYFVPADTAGYSEYYAKVVQKALVYHFAFEFADKNRKHLNQLKTAVDFEKFLKDKNILKDFIKYASSKGIQEDKQDLKVSGKIIETQLKAYIARNIIGEEGFYPIIQKIDHTLKQAIIISESNESMAQLLAVTN